MNQTQISQQAIETNTLSTSFTHTHKNLSTICFTIMFDSWRRSNRENIYSLHMRTHTVCYATEIIYPFKLIQLIKIYAKSEKGLERVISKHNDIVLFFNQLVPGFFFIYVLRRYPSYFLFDTECQNNFWKRITLTNCIVSYYLKYVFWNM